MKLRDVVDTIKARQILTSRGLPTIEIQFDLGSTRILASVPSGKSTGHQEACIILDGDNTKYFGLSVHKVIKRINSMLDEIMEMEVESVETELIRIDGTLNKSNLGANFILPFGICCCKLLAHLSGISLWKYLKTAKSRIPIPHFNILNGGLHSGNGTSCQEIMVCFGNRPLPEAVELAVKFYNCLKKVIAGRYGKIYCSVGDEGGFAPPIKNIEEGLDLIVESAEESKIDCYMIALDLAANSFCLDCNKANHNDMEFNKEGTGSGAIENNQHSGYLFDGKMLTGKELANYLTELTQKYPIYSIEDPFCENDIESWRYFYKLAGDKINIVSDDLTVSNPGLISRLGTKNDETKAFNTVLIKPNQIGSVTETIQSIRIAQEAGLKTMISHRSAETEDVFISHLAVGMGTEYFKAGAPCRGERIAKYNELLRIYEEYCE